MLNRADQEQLDNNFTYHAPNDFQRALYDILRASAKCQASIVMLACPASRERSLAITKIEEAVMWANAAIARNS